MSRWIERLDRRFYPNCGDNWDDRLFRDLILQYCKPSFHVLDIGAGAGIVPHMNFKGHAARICGVDPDPRVAENPYLDEGRVAMAESIPYRSSSFELVFSDNVLEHLENPEKVFSEIERVLKPGGILLVKTPNKRHYVPLIARLTPHAFHRFFNRLRGRQSEDTFPTMYRANSPKEVRSLAAVAGLKVVDISLIESRPEYLRISSLTYVLGIFYERLVNRFICLSGFRVLLMGVFKKPSVPTVASP